MTHQTSIHGRHGRRVAHSVDDAREESAWFLFLLAILLVIGIGFIGAITYVVLLG